MSKSAEVLDAWMCSPKSKAITWQMSRSMIQTYNCIHFASLHVLETPSGPLTKPSGATYVFAAYPAAVVHFIAVRLVSVQESHLLPRPQYVSCKSCVCSIAIVVCSRFLFFFIRRGGVVD